MKQLFCDCKTDEEKSKFFLSGRAVESGVIAPALVNDVAMAYHRCAEFKKETDTLRAKVEAMEQQEPVMWANSSNINSSRINKERGGCGDQHTCSETQTTYHDTPLYALPGAQPAPGVQDESVRKAWARFSNELHRSPDAPYPGMSAAFEQHFSQSFTDREWRAEAATWAAAWKAAKRHGAQPAPIIPEGWKLAPIEPTKEMLEAGQTEWLDSAGADPSFDVYRSMLAAAPEPKP